MNFWYRNGQLFKGIIIYARERLSLWGKSHPILIKNKEVDEPRGSKEQKNIWPICPNNTLPKAVHA